MNKSILTLAAKFNELSQRERVLALASVIGLSIYLVFMVAEANVGAYNGLSDQIKQLKSKNTLTEQINKEYEISLTLDPNEQFRKKLEKLEQQLINIDNEFTLKNVIPSAYMASLLEKLLAKATDVKLISLDSLAPESVLQLGQENKMNLYQHGARLSLQGEYFAVMRFLESIENMPDKLHWRMLNISVEKYPLANVLVEFYTLSINKEFISV